MRYLVISNIFPGRMAPIAAWLASRPENDVMLATSWNRGSHEIPGIRWIKIKKPDRRKNPENAPEYWEEAAIVADRARYSFTRMIESGFVPEIVLVSSASGSALGVAETFPSAFIVNYLEPRFFHKRDEAAMRFGLQCVQSIQSDMVYAFSEPTRREFADILRKPIGQVPYCVDTDFFDCEKAGSPKRDLTVIALEGMREGEFLAWASHASGLAAKGRKVVLRAPGLAAKRLLLERMAGLRALEEGNLLVECGEDAQKRRDTFSRARLFVSPRAGLDADMLEAMSCGAPLCGGPGGPGFIDDGLTPEKALENAALLEKTGQEARKRALRCHDSATLIPVHVGEILESCRRKR